MSEENIEKEPAAQREPTIEPNSANAGVQVIDPNPATPGATDSNMVLWHGPAESVLKYMVTGNARSANPAILSGLQVTCEDHLSAILGKAGRKADLTVVRPAGVIIPGPLGYFLGSISSIEYKSPSDSCTMETMLKSWFYTLAKALEFHGTIEDPVRDLATVIVCAQKPNRLLGQLKHANIGVRESKEYSGFYHVYGPGIPRTLIVAVGEMKYCRYGYSWLTWFRTNLTERDGRVLMEHLRVAPEKEKEVATKVAFVALQANPSVLEKLLEDKNMSDEVSRVIAPLVAEKMKPVTAELKRKDEQLKHQEELLKSKDEQLESKNEQLESKDEQLKHQEERFDALLGLFNTALPAIKNTLDEKALARAQELGVPV